MKVKVVQIDINFMSLVVSIIVLYLKEINPFVTELKPTLRNSSKQEPHPFNTLRTR